MGKTFRRDSDLGFKRAKGFNKSGKTKKSNEPYKKGKTKHQEYLDELD